MQIVIDIPKGFYEHVKGHKDIFTYGLINGEKIGEIIANGIPLPEHGRLIDGDELKIKFKLLRDFFINSYGSFSNHKSRVDEITHGIAEIINAPTILEATREGE